jgi:ABC-type phosphate transport system substrate-binding protein
MKRFVIALVAAAILAACAAGVPETPLAADGPAFAAQVASTRAEGARAVYPVRSVYAVVYAKGYGGAAYTLNGTCSLTRGPNGIVTGCEISGGSRSPYYTKSTFDLRSKPNGDGCTLAIGHFHGQTHAGRPIPIAFYWAKNPCYP